MQFDLVAERQHYRDHLLPIWRAIPEAMRGTDEGVGPAARNSDNILLVAGYSDVKRHPHRRIVYVEHGAGQSYIGLPAAVEPFYSPLKRTKQHRNVILFLCPNDEVRDRWARSYGDIAVTVGCPLLDPWHSGMRNKPEPRTVAITFHWEPPASVWAVVPELKSGFDFYWRALRECIPRWRADGWTVIGTAHPRAVGVREFFFSECRETVEFVTDSADVLSRAAILIADNTSLQAEMMSLGRGVVWLNHPSYRRDVEHGGRFWHWPEQSGTSISTTTDLLHLDLDDVEKATWHPYVANDGHATERAVAALLSL